MNKSIFSYKYTEFLRLLKKTRVDAGLTQLSVANLLGRPQSFISKCEHGERRVDVIELTELCKIYGTNIHTFLDELLTNESNKSS